MPYLKTCICKYIWLLPVVKYRQLYFTYSRAVHFTNYYTLSENLKLCPKHQFSEKSQWFFCDFETLISIRIWIFTPKIVKIQHFQLLLILYLHKITIFGAKIQIIQGNMTFKYSQKSVIFCSKIQIQNFECF